MARIEEPPEDKRNDSSSNSKYSSEIHSKLDTMLRYIYSLENKIDTVKKSHNLVNLSSRDILEITNKYTHKFTISMNDFVIDLVETFESSNVYVKVSDLASLCIEYTTQKSLEYKSNLHPNLHARVLEILLTMYSKNEKLELETIYDFVFKMISNPLFVDTIIAESEKYFISQYDVSQINREINSMKEHILSYNVEVNVEPEPESIKRLGLESALKDNAELANAEACSDGGLEWCEIVDAKFKYSGYVNSNKQKHGFGVYRDEKVHYIGYWLQDLKHGWGWIVYYDNHSSQYVGEFKANSRHGFGILKWNYNLSKLTGYWSHNKKDGKCIYEWFDRNWVKTTEYIGFYENDKRTGFGRTRWLNDVPSMYHIGWYRNGHMDGYCIYAYKDNAYYDGYYVKGTRQGYGTYYWSDNSYYDGYWKEGKKEGYGEYYYKHSDYYKGQWLMDSRHNFGIYYYGRDEMKGYIYEGEWNRGKRHGKGVLLRPGAMREEGNWKENEFIGQDMIEYNSYM